MAKQMCWIIGKLVKLPNGHEYIAEPYVVFDTQEDAIAARTMIEDVSREHVGMREAALHRAALKMEGRDG